MAISIKNIKVDALLKISLSKRVLILVAINVLVAFLFYQFLIGPKYAANQELNVKSEDLTKQVEDNRRVAADIPRYEQEKKDMEVRLEKALSQLPNANEIPSLLQSIGDSAREAGLKITLFKPGSSVYRGFYADVPVDMEVQGDYESLYSFCDKVGKLPRIVNIQNIDTSLINPQDMTNLTPQIRAKFVTLTFRFVSEEEAKAVEGKKK